VMVMLSAGTMDVEVVTDMASAELDPEGRVVAELWLRCGADAYPNWGWRDCPVIVLRWWLAELRKLVKLQNDIVTLAFVQAPHRVEVSQVGRYSLRIQAVRGDGSDDRVLGAHVTRKDRFVRSICSTAQNAVAHCKEQRWTQDLAELERGLSLLQGCVEEPRSRSRPPPR